MLKMFSIIDMIYKKFNTIKVPVNRYSFDNFPFKTVEMLPSMLKCANAIWYLITGDASSPLHITCETNWISRLEFSVIHNYGNEFSSYILILGIYKSVFNTVCSINNILEKIFANESLYQSGIRGCRYNLL